MNDFGGREDRARKTKDGIRVRLRNSPRKHGVTEKFRTDQTRDGTLLVISKTILYFHLPNLKIFQLGLF